MSSACKDKVAFSSPRDPYQKPLSGSNRFLGQNSREWARSPPLTLPFLRTNNDGKPFPHSMEPQLRKLGLATRMVAGVPSLTAEHAVCRKRNQLTSEQVRRPLWCICLYPFLWDHLSRFNY